MSLTFYTTKKVENTIRKRGVFLDDLMYTIQQFFLEKNEASKIKHVRFALNDVIEEDKYVRRSLVGDFCADSLPNDLINELNEMLAREFLSLNAFAKLHCEYESDILPP
jgi:hypothetical protein